MPDTLAGHTPNGMPQIKFDLIPSGCQWSLRLPQSAIDRATTAWRAPLDLAPLASSTNVGRHALRLGPDEWLLIADRPEAANDLCDLSRSLPMSLVDVSHRDLCWQLEGPGANAVLGAGCPLDLSDTAFPAGRATRTLLGQAEVLLWRQGAEPAWQIRALRSYANYIIRHVHMAIQHCGAPMETNR